MHQTHRHSELLRGHLPRGQPPLQVKGRDLEVGVKGHYHKLVQEERMYGRIHADSGMRNKHKWISGLCKYQRYIPEIPEPALSLSRHGVHLGGFRVFPVIKITGVHQEHMSLHLLWTEREDVAHVKIMETLVLCLFVRTWSAKNPMIPNLSAMADDIITLYDKGILGSLVYICRWICRL